MTSYTQIAKRTKLLQKLARVSATFSKAFAELESLGALVKRTSATDPEPLLLLDLVRKQLDKILEMRESLDYNEKIQAIEARLS